MSSVREVSTEIELDLTDIPTSKVKAAKREVRDYLIEEILRDVGNGKSPVTDKKFRKLEKKYAKKEHGGRRLPILELEGNMLDALKSKGTSKNNNKLEIGIFGSEAPKADGHNQNSAEAKAWARSTDRTKYRRQFIPDDSKNESFKKSITGEVDTILDGYRITPERREREEQRDVGEVDSVIEEPDRINISIGDVFGDEVIENLLLQELIKQGRL